MNVLFDGGATSEASLGSYPVQNFQENGGPAVLPTRGCKPSLAALTGTRRIQFKNGHSSNRVIPVWRVSRCEYAVALKRKMAGQKIVQPLRDVDVALHHWILPCVEAA